MEGWVVGFGGSLVLGQFHQVKTLIEIPEVKRECFPVGVPISVGDSAPSMGAKM